MDKESLETLSARQAECLRLVARDRDAKEIARILGISDETVERHIKLAMRKLGASSRFAAARALADYEGRTHPMVMPLDRATTGGTHPDIALGDGPHRRDEPAPDELREMRMTFDHSAAPPFLMPDRIEVREVRNLLSVPKRLGLCVLAFIALAVGLAGVGSSMRELSRWIHDRAAAQR